MKKDIISRYELDDDGNVIIDTSIKTVEDLYNFFDRMAPYIKKDLDQEFVDYLIDCVREIGGYNFVIRISLINMPDNATMERVRGSIGTFFGYLQELEKKAIRSMFRRSFVLFGIGLGLLACAIVANRRISGNEGVWLEVFAQGLTVAAWVSLWEAIANIFLEWHPHRRDIKTYSRIIHARVMFRQLPA